MNNQEEFSIWCSKGGLLLDIRPPALFEQKHLISSTNIPQSELLDRLFELPKKSVKFSLFGGSDDVVSTREFLEERGWTIQFMFYDTDDIWKSASSHNYVATNGSNRANKKWILFSPCSFLEECIPFIENSLLQDDQTDSMELEWSVCDIGCGSGRDMIWLAIRDSQSRTSDSTASDEEKFKQLSEPRSGSWDVIKGVDFNNKALNRLWEFAENYGVTHKISTVRARIRRDGLVTLHSHMNSSPDPNFVDSPTVPLANSPLSDLPTQSLLGSSEQSQTVEQQESESELDFTKQTYDLVLVIRFVERSFFPILSQIVSNGGFLLCFQFMEGAEKFGHPKDPNLILKDGELSSFFKAHDFEIVIDRRELLPDGRPMNAFLGRKLK